MIDSETMGMIAQFGSAGLIGWLWVTERRISLDRDKRVSDAHERLMSERTSIDALLRALDANTRALTALESSQRGIERLLERMGDEMHREPAGQASESRERAAA
jgi:hypothetical protein